MSELAVRIKPLFNAEAIARRIEELAREIAGAALVDPIIVAVLKGSFIFAADPIRALHREGLSPEIDFIFLASYGAGTVSHGEVKVLRDVESEFKGRDVVIVDDILDSGRTLAFVKALLEKRGAVRVLTCVLIEKEVPRAVPIVPDFSGFVCPNVFVIGYGMDLAHRYRELPYIVEISGELPPARNPSRLDQ
jgi:hypoxanthine phosphoribosyltransferase